MSGIIIDRTLLYLKSQSAEFRPGDALVSVIFEIAGSGFKVRVKSGMLKSIHPLTIFGKSKKEETHIFKVENDARRYYREQIELLRRAGFDYLAPTY